MLFSHNSFPEKPLLIEMISCHIIRVYRVLANFLITKHFPIINYAFGLAFI